MTCYFRHLQEIFKRADVNVTSQNKQDVDRIIHRIVGVKYKNCSAAWKEVKKRLAEDEAGFVLKLKEEWRTRPREAE